MPGLATVSPQQGHTILKDMSDGRTCVYIYRKSGGRGLNAIERRNLQKCYTKSTAELQAVGLTELDTTQRATGLLCCIKVMCCTVTKQILR